MKAIVYEEYGSPDVLEFQDVDKPIPKNDEVLIKVHAASLNKADSYVLGGKPFLVRLMGAGLFRPKNTIPGADISGRVEAIGSDVQQFQVGDDVFGELSDSGWGGFAEYVCASEQAIAKKSPNISYEDAAAAPMAGVTALQGLRDKGQIQPGQKVLINGASGGVGTFAVQIAKSFGGEVTAVCSTGNLEQALSIGADHVIDYTAQDFTTSGQYDLIFAVNGDRSISEYKRALTSDGVYVCSGGAMTQIFQAMLLGPFISMTGSKKIRGVSARANQNDLVYMNALLEEGKIKPAIDRRFPLSETADAFRYLSRGHASGKVVITVEQLN